MVVVPRVVVASEVALAPLGAAVRSEICVVAGMLTVDGEVPGTAPVPVVGVAGEVASASSGIVGRPQPAATPDSVPP